jgi:hypothetical protein
MNKEETPVLLHRHDDFEALLRIIADREGIEPVLIEKDYWIMQALFGLQQQGLSFQLKGGTSLSKGHKIIDRFSEDLDILIEPPSQLGFDLNATSQKDNAVESRKRFYDWLAETIKIDGFENVVRDTEFDDTSYYRSGGIRLLYKSYFGSLPVVKDGILLEVGFSQVTPNEPITISSWAYDFSIAEAPEVFLIDNRAKGVQCYGIYASGEATNYYQKLSPRNGKRCKT